MIIYKITCLINNRTYIGQTVNPLKTRWWQHCHAKDGKKSMPYIDKAIRKYGSENFTIEQIAEASSLDELNELEGKFIKELNSLKPNGYNLDSGGKNKRVHEDTKRAMSELSKNHWKDPSFRERVIAGNTGRKNSDESKKNQSDGAKRRWSDEEERKRQSERCTGKIVSEETKQRMRHPKSTTENMKKPKSEAHIAALKEAFKNREGRGVLRSDGFIYKTIEDARKDIHVGYRTMVKIIKLGLIVNSYTFSFLHFEVEG
jgi:group I intron endonuclease